MMKLNDVQHMLLHNLTSTQSEATTCCHHGDNTCTFSFISKYQIQLFLSRHMISKTDALSSFSFKWSTERKEDLDIENGSVHTSYVLSKLLQGSGVRWVLHRGKQSCSASVASFTITHPLFLSLAHLLRTEPSLKGAALCALICCLKLTKLTAGLADDKSVWFACLPSGPTATS